MEAVDELEAERDQEGDEQQDEGRIAGHLRAGRIQILIDAVGHEKQPGRQDSHEDDRGQRMLSAVEIGALAPCRLDQARQCRDVGHGVPSPSPQPTNLRERCDSCVKPTLCGAPLRRTQVHEMMRRNSPARTRPAGVNAGSPWP
jgi:hypothetical protein